MTPSSLVSHNDHSAQQSMALDPWGDKSQYAPIPGNFYWSPTFPSDISCTNFDTSSPIDCASLQQTASQKNSVPLHQFGDWEEGRTYDVDPPACIHYLIQWRVTRNNRTVAKHTEHDLILAPRFLWRLFLQMKLKELLIRKYPHRILESDVVISATQQKGLTLKFDGTDIHLTSIEKQVFDCKFKHAMKVRMKVVQ